MDCIVKLNLAQSARQTVESTIIRLNTRVDSHNYSLEILETELKSKDKSIKRKDNLIKTLQNELVYKDIQLEASEIMMQDSKKANLSDIAGLNLLISHDKELLDK